jgi:N-acetyl-anhydromuramyl-L-alanine amidase AmpD
MLSIDTYGKFRPLGKSKRKKQIILCHTSRLIEDYLNSLTYRFNNHFDRVPNYVITREGKIYNILPDLTYSNFFSNDDVNKNSISICLENLGWLDKKPFSNDYINWNGSIYKGQVYEKKWRDYFFWQPYTNVQVESMLNLCELLIESLEIKSEFVGHNTKVDGIENFEGITTRSNYDTRFTDLNPSFDFENLNKIFKNEQFTQ